MMSKAVAEVITDVVGIEMAWVDPWNKPPVGSKLYTTDHAEDLAKALEAMLKDMQREILPSDKSADLMDKADNALTNYREATE